MTVAALLVLYVASYLAISRHGMAIARRHDFTDCFYYIQPPSQPSLVWFIGTIGLCIFYWPLNVIDQAIGTGMQPIANALYLSAIDGPIDVHELLDVVGFNPLSAVPPMDPRMA